MEAIPGRTPHSITAAALKREVAALADPERARFLQAFFRTGPGEYAEGDRLLGLTVPASRKMARRFQQILLPELHKLLLSPFHEHRLIALIILVDRHRKAGEITKRELHRFFLDHLHAANNWDLVDTSAQTLVGEHIADHPDLLDRLARSTNLWHRRIAIVSTFAELRAGRTGETLRVAEKLLGDPHHLIHKAIGWLLRECGKVSAAQMLEFLRIHYNRLPRTTLRYAIERLPESERKKWLAGQSHYFGE